MILGVVGLTALAISLWDRDWRWLKTTRAWWGFLIVALVVLPWLIAITLQAMACSSNNPWVTISATSLSADRNRTARRRAIIWHSRR